MHFEAKFLRQTVHILLKPCSAFVTMIFRSVPDVQLKRYLNLIFRTAFSIHLKF